MGIPTWVSTIGPQTFGCPCTGVYKPHRPYLAAGSWLQPVGSIRGGEHLLAAEHHCGSFLHHARSDCPRRVDCGSSLHSLKLHPFLFLPGSIRRWWRLLDHFFSLVGSICRRGSWYAAAGTAGNLLGDDSSHYGGCSLNFTALRVPLLSSVIVVRISAEGILPVNGGRDAARVLILAERQRTGTIVTDHQRTMIQRQ